MEPMNGVVNSESVPQLKARLGVRSGRGRNPTLIWIDPVKLAMRLSKSSPSMRSIQGAVGMIHDGGSC